MSKKLSFLLVALLKQLGVTPGVTTVGILGVVLGMICALVAAVRGADIPPEGNLVDTAKFDAAIGFFLLTMSVLVSGVNWTSRGKERWSTAVVTVSLYGYLVETVQAFRGLDPRFSKVAGPVDQIAGLVFFITALGLMGCFGVLVIKYFRSEPTPLNIAVRYGAIASLIGFLVGFWMSLVTQGRTVVEAGDLLLVHAVGFHGIQAVPIVALFLQWSRTSYRSLRDQVHLAGLTWVSACLALAWQSLNGRATFVLQPAPLAAGFCLFVFAAAAATAVFGWLRDEVPVDHRG